jgi:hypothetical protein
MTYRWTDPDGHQLEATPEAHWDNEPVVTIWARGEYGTRVPVRIPVDRIEELVAGIRDTARQAAIEEQHA